MDPDISEPWATTIEAGPLVRYEWTFGDHWYHVDLGHTEPCLADSAHLLVWHDCAKILGPGTVAPGERHGWRPAGVGLHTVTQVEPLTLVASLYWPDCCGLHGWITDGVWVSA